MKVYFEKTICPCVVDQIILWHVAHGYVWNVLHNGERIAVFFATLLCGDGCVLHFTTVPGVEISPAVCAAAFRKGVRIAAPMGVIFATIPAEKKKLLSVAKHIGFMETSGNFQREGTGEIVLLKYINPQNGILNTVST